MKALSVAAFGSWVEKELTIIDTRSITAIAPGFIKGSIAFDGSIHEYAKNFLGAGPFLVVCKEDEAAALEQQLNQAGISDVKGYLEGGFEAWVQAGGATDMVIDVEADELMMDIPFDDNLVILDVRPEVSFGSGHLKDAVNIPLAALTDPVRVAAIEENDNLYLISNSDKESFLAATILKKQEIHNLRVVLGGWAAVEQEKKAEIVKEPGMLN